MMWADYLCDPAPSQSTHDWGYATICITTCVSERLLRTGNSRRHWTSHISVSAKIPRHREPETQQTENQSRQCFLWQHDVNVFTHSQAEVSFSSITGWYTLTTHTREGVCTLEEMVQCLNMSPITPQVHPPSGCSASSLSVTGTSVFQDQHTHTQNQIFDMKSVSAA